MRLLCVPAARSQFTCFTGTKVQMLTPVAADICGHYSAGTQFTCFTGTKVHIVTPVTATALVYLKASPAVRWVVFALQVLV